MHFVCTGNICRSPFCQAYLASKLTSPELFSVDSSGMFVLEERPVAHAMRTLIKEFANTNEFEHKSTQANSASLASKDLIVCLTRDHRSAVLEECPGAFARTFTLIEIGRLIASAQADGIDLPADGTAKERLRKFVRQLGQRRSLVDKLEKPELEDIKDPYRLSDEIYREAATDMIVPLDILARVLNQL